MWLFTNKISLMNYVHQRQTNGCFIWSTMEGVLILRLYNLLRLVFHENWSWLLFDHVCYSFDLFRKPNSNSSEKHLFFSAQNQLKEKCLMLFCCAVKLKHNLSIEVQVTHLQLLVRANQTFITLPRHLKVSPWDSKLFDLKIQHHPTVLPQSLSFLESNSPIDLQFIDTNGLFISINETFKVVDCPAGFGFWNGKLNFSIWNFVFCGWIRQDSVNKASGFYSLTQDLNSCHKCPSEGAWPL